MLAPEVWTSVSHWLEVGDLLNLCWTSRLRCDSLRSIGQLNFTQAAHCNISLSRLCPQVRCVTAEVVKNGEPNAELAELLPHVLTCLPKLERISLGEHWHSQEDSISLVRVVHRLLSDLCVAFRAGHLKKVKYISHGCHCCLLGEQGFKQECICGRLVAFFPTQNLIEYIGEQGLCIPKHEIARIAVSRGVDVNGICEANNGYHEIDESKTWFHWLIERMFNYDADFRYYLDALNLFVEHGHAQISEPMRHAAHPATSCNELFESEPHDSSYQAKVIRWVSESDTSPGQLPVPLSYPVHTRARYKAKENVPVLSDPDIGSQILEWLPQGTTFTASDERVQLGNGRRFLRLADRPAWVSVHGQDYQACVKPMR